MKRFCVIVLMVLVIINIVSCSVTVSPSSEPYDMVSPSEAADNIPSDVLTSVPSTETSPTEKPQISESVSNSTSTIPIIDKSGYFSSSEAQFNGILVNITTVDQMIELLGQPDKTEDQGADTDYERTVYFYDDIQYISLGNSNKITTIVVTTYSEADSPREIRVGESLESVLSKFPYEQDPEGNGDGIFFGQWNSQRGALSDEILSDGIVVKKLVVTSESEDPFMIVRFKDDIVYEITVTIMTD